MQEQIVAQNSGHGNPPPVGEAEAVSVLVGAYAAAERGEVGVRLQGGLVQVRVPGRQPEWLVGVRRGVVVGFSKGSQRRLLSVLSRVGFPEDGAGLFFGSVTYHDRWPDGRGVKRDLNVLWRRIFRFFPMAWLVWRLEFQERGAPHLHFITNVELGEGLLRLWWQDVTGDSTITEVDVAPVKSYVRLRRYVSKYLGKVSGPPPAPRRQGGPAAAECACASAAAGCSLEGDGECLTEGAYEAEGGGWGRVWGVKGQENVTWAAVKEYVLPDTRWLTLFQRLARHLWARVGKGRQAGFTLFVGNAEAWERALGWCLCQTGGVTVARERGRVGAY